MSRFAKYASRGRVILTGLIMVATVSAWGCGGKEPGPPPGAEKQPTNAPEVSIPGAEPTTPPADKK